MRIEQTLILTREDMTFSSKHKDTDNMSRLDIKENNKYLDKANMVLFIDDDGETKILKNRFGKTK